MKKVLSLVLAVMMVVGMTTMAFAAPKTVKVTFEAGNKLWFGEPDNTATPPNSKIKPVTAPAGLSDITVLGADEFGELVKPVTSGVKFSKASVSADNKTITVELQFAQDGEYKISLANAQKVVYFDDTDPDPAKHVYKASTDKIPDAKIVTVGGTGTTDPVNPDPGTGILSVVPSNWRIKELSGKGSWTAAAKIDIASNDKLPITADMFNWEVKGSDGKYRDATSADLATIKPDASLRSSHLSNVGVRRVYQKGTSNTIDTVDIKVKDGKSYVEVKTVDYYVSTKATDVELKLALTYKSKTSNIEAYYAFTMENAKEIIEEGQNEAFSYGHVFLEADATVRNVEFQGDEDGIVYATKTVVKGQKYYFNVTSKLEKEDEQIIADNPEVDSIYTVRQVNMANATVQFKNLDREFFVYDGEGKLLGTTKDTKLPLASKYILTTAKVDFGGEEEPVEEPTEPEAPPMGGGEVVEAPNTYNPNTGL